MDHTLPARVQRGMARLDERVPGWRHRLNQETLDMSSHEDGLLEQLFGSFATGHRVLRIGMVSAARFGFDLACQAGEETTEDWEALTAEWQRQLVDSETQNQ